MTIFTNTTALNLASTLKDITVSTTGTGTVTFDSPPWWRRYQEERASVDLQLAQMQNAQGWPTMNFQWRNGAWHPVQEAPKPTACAHKCECGSGSNERSGAHSHWCQLWVSE